MRLIDPPLFVPTAMNRQLKKSITDIDAFLYSIINERRSLPPGDDLLSILMQMRDEETGEVMSDEQLRDEVLITFFAGHETTAQLLTWGWYLLAQDERVKAQFHDELDRVLGSRSPGLEDVGDLAYTRMIMDETLRLYSPVALTARDAVEDDLIDGYLVPAGSVVTVTPFITHRMPDYWEYPDAFYPEHFTEDAMEARPKYAYYPFGAGPRICLGMHFALLEGLMVLAEVGQKFELDLIPGQDIQPHWSGTLRPDNDIHMRVPVENKLCLISQFIEVDQLRFVYLTIQGGNHVTTEGIQTWHGVQWSDRTHI
jgi:cytochrome P450